MSKPSWGWPHLGPMVGAASLLDYYYYRVGGVQSQLWTTCKYSPLNNLAEVDISKEINHPNKNTMLRRFWIDVKSGLRRNLLEIKKIRLINEELILGEFNTYKICRMQEKPKKRTSNLFERFQQTECGTSITEIGKPEGATIGDSYKRQEVVRKYG